MFLVRCSICDNDKNNLISQKFVTYFCVFLCLWNSKNETQEWEFVEIGNKKTTLATLEALKVNCFRLHALSKGTWIADLLQASCENLFLWLLVTSWSCSFVCFVFASFFFFGNRLISSLWIYCFFFFFLPYPQKNTHIFKALNDCLDLQFFRWWNPNSVHSTPFPGILTINTMCKTKDKHKDQMGEKHPNSRLR